MITTNNISHKYTADSQFAFPDFSCSAEETLLVLGQSGVGKTTLLHILAGILKPNKGQVNIDGTSLYKLSTRKRDQYRGQNIGIVFQRPHFIQSLSARENLEIAQKITQGNNDGSAITALLDQLNLGHRAKAKTFTMSQGEQQRLSIARALISKPKLILADEPTSALDDKNCDEVIKLLSQHATNAQAALIVVTHDNRLKKVFNNYIDLNAQ